MDSKELGRQMSQDEEVGIDYMPNMPTYEETVEPEPVPVPATVPGKRGRKKVNKRFFNSHLDQLFPSSKQIKVFKVDELGKVKYIRHYTASDLEQYTDIESFIKTHLVNKFGGGDYVVKLVGQDGTESMGVTVSVLDDILPNEDPGETTSRQLNDRLLDRLQQLEDERANRREPTLSDKLKELAELKEALGITKEDKSDPIVLLTMLDKLSGRSQGYDPALEEIRAIKEELRALSQPQPMPLPPEQPPIDLVGLTKQIVEVTKPPYSLADVIELTKPKEDPNKLTIKDLVALLPTVTPLIEKLTGKSELAELKDIIRAQAEIRQPERTLKDMLEEIKLVQEVVGGPVGGASDGGFLGVIKDLIKNLPQTAEAVAKILSGLRRGGPVSDVVVPIQPKQQVVEQKPKPQVKTEWPHDFVNKIREINTAQDAQQSITATITAFSMLGASPPHVGLLRQLIALLGKGERPDALQFLKDFLNDISTQCQLLPEAVAATVKAFDDNYEAVVEFILVKTGQKQPEPQVVAEQPLPEPEETDESEEPVVNGVN